MALTERIEPSDTRATPRGVGELFFADLVAETHGRLSALARRLVGNVPDAADLVQETYIRAWRALPQFRGDAELSTWLHAILVNVARTHLRRLPPAESFEALPERADLRALDPASWAEVTTLRAEVEAAVADLSPAMREVVVLGGFEDLSHKAVGECLGISESAATVRLHRARKRLRESVAAGAEWG